MILLSTEFTRSLYRYQSILGEYTAYTIGLLPLSLVDAHCKTCIALFSDESIFFPFASLGVNRVQTARDSFHYSTLIRRGVSCVRGGSFFSTDFLTCSFLSPCRDRRWLNSLSESVNRCRFIYGTRRVVVNQPFAQLKFVVEGGEMFVTGFSNLTTFKTDRLRILPNFKPPSFSTIR